MLICLPIVKIRSQGLILTFLFLYLLTALTSCGNHQVSGNDVYYVDWNGGRGTIKTSIAGADAASFKELSYSLYGADRNYVYFENIRLQDANPQYFVALSDLFGKDNRFAYYQNFKIKGVHSPSFHIVDQGPYSKDKNDYYFDSVALKVTGLSSFKILSQKEGYDYWAKDRTHYYINNTKYPLSDYATFTRLGNGYAKDKYQVYFIESVVKNADPKTFKTINYGEAEDKYASYHGLIRVHVQDQSSYKLLEYGFTKDRMHVYLHDTIVTGADPATFEIADRKWERDRSSYFYLGKRVAIINHDTFTLLTSNYSADRFRVYYNDQVVLGADPRTFQINDLTLIGTDKNGCYKGTEKTDCANNKTVISTEEN